MKTNRFCMLVPCIALAALMLHGVTVEAAPLDFTGRGVYRFSSASGCPSGGHDPAPSECNRIAIDQPETRVSVDPVTQTIEFVYDTRQKSEMMVGDVLLQGSGVTEQGKRVPLSLHLLLRRNGKKWDVDSYVHAPVAGNFSSVSIDPYNIAVREGNRSRVLVTPERARDMFADPSMRRRLARALVSVRPTSGGAGQGDITVALGLGKFTTSVLRASFTSNEPSSSGGLERSLQHGNWAIELEALSDRIPLWVVQRELFLFGLDSHPALRTVRSTGLKNHDKLTFGTRDGQGFLRLNGQEAVFDGATASGQAFLQESFMGLILAWQRSQAGQATADSAPSPKTPRT